VRLATELTNALQARGESVSTAESLTGGLLCAYLTAAPGASNTVRGGVVAYMTEVKHSVVGVDALLLREHGAVSAPTAVALAQNARQMFASTWSVAATGVAGPTEQEGKPVGTVFVAAVGPRMRAVAELHLNGDRVRVREQSCAAAIGLLHRLLE
jgi:PncC family amidohydrolase